MHVDIKNIVNLDLETFYAQNLTSYSTDVFSDRRSKRIEYGIEGRNYFFTDLTIGYDFTKQIIQASITEQFVIRHYSGCIVNSDF